MHGSKASVSLFKSSWNSRDVSGMVSSVHVFEWIRILGSIVPGRSQDTGDGKDLDGRPRRSRFKSKISNEVFSAGPPNRRFLHRDDPWESRCQSLRQRNACIGALAAEDSRYVFDEGTVRATEFSDRKSTEADQCRSTTQTNRVLVAKAEEVAVPHPCQMRACARKGREEQKLDQNGQKRNRKGRKRQDRTRPSQRALLSRATLHKRWL